MSVHVWERGPSDAEFLHTARQLHIEMIRKAVKFPKRFTFYVSQDMAQTASNIHKFIVRGNSIHPQNQHEAQMRRDMFIKAGIECRALNSLLETAGEMFVIQPSDKFKLCSLIAREINLIKGEMKSAKQRYKNLPA